MPSDREPRTTWTTLVGTRALALRDARNEPGPTVKVRTPDVVGQPRVNLDELSEADLQDLLVPAPEWAVEKKPK